MDYNKNAELFEELSGVSKKYNLTIMVAQQPPCEFNGYTREIKLSPHTGESRSLGVFLMDHINLL